MQTDPPTSSIAGLAFDFPTALTVAGIALSIVFFWISYRQTIGAKKERTRAADLRIVDALMKRLVLEELVPTYEEIERFTAGVAADNGLEETDVIDVEAAIDRLYSRVLENDFIAPDQRFRMMEKLRSVDEVVENEESDYADVTPGTSKLIRYVPSNETFLLALASAVAASALVLVIGWVYGGNLLRTENLRELLPPVIVTFIAGLATLIPVVLLKRTQDRREQPRQPIIQFKSPTERTVSELLNRNKLPFEYSARGAYDFRVQGKHGSFLVLVRSRTNDSVENVKFRIRRLDYAIRNGMASKAFIVLPNVVPAEVAVLRSQPINIVSLEEFDGLLRDL